MSLALTLSSVNTGGVRAPGSPDRDVLLFRPSAVDSRQQGLWCLFFLPLFWFDSAVGRRGECLWPVILHLFHITVLVELWLTLTYWPSEECSSSLQPPRANIENRRGPSYRKFFYKGTSGKGPWAPVRNCRAWQGCKSRSKKDVNHRTSDYLLTFLAGF